MTDEYIRREDALRALYTDYAYAAMDVIKEVPAADVAVVVRCKDCAKHYVTLGRDMCARNATGSGDHLFGLTATRPDDFCSRGVRKEATSTDE